MKENSNTSVGDNWSYHFNNLKTNKYGDNDFYRRILDHFYRAGEGWKEFEKYFESEWIKNYRIE